MSNEECVNTDTLSTRIVLRLPEEGMEEAEKANTISLEES